MSDQAREGHEKGSLRSRIDFFRTLTLAGHPLDAATSSDLLSMLDFMEELLDTVERLEAKTERRLMPSKEEDDVPRKCH